MSPAEARQWLRGNRTVVHLVDRSDPDDNVIERVARADAAMTEQAYWMLRGIQDGLVEREGNDE